MKHSESLAEMPLSSFTPVPSMGVHEHLDWRSFVTMQSATRSPLVAERMKMAAANVVRLHLALRMIQELEWEEGREAY